MLTEGGAAHSILWSTVLTAGTQERDGISVLNLKKAKPEEKYLKHHRDRKRQNQGKTSRIVLTFHFP